jgi:hypothetical protein
MAPLDDADVERIARRVVELLRQEAPDTAASEAIAAGDGAEEVSWLLGHKDSVTTRRIYIRELQTAERRAKRRAKLEARYGSLLEASVEAGRSQQGFAEGSSGQAEVLRLRAEVDRGQ